jgi:hypothetical protein
MVIVDFAGHAQEWIAAWNAHDLERILTCYTDDVELTSPFVAKLMGRSDGLLHGKPALRHYFARGLKTYPTLRFELIRLYSGIRSCVLEYRSVNGVRAVELMEFNQEGKVRRVLAHYYDECVTKDTNTAKWSQKRPPEFHNLEVK